MMTNILFCFVYFWSFVYAITTITPGSYIYQARLGSSVCVRFEAPYSGYDYNLVVDDEDGGYLENLVLHSLTKGQQEACVGMKGTSWSSNSYLTVDLQYNLQGVWRKIDSVEFTTSSYDQIYPYEIQNAYLSNAICVDFTNTGGYFTQNFVLMVIDQVGFYKYKYGEFGALGDDEELCVPLDIQQVQFSCTFEARLLDLDTQNVLDISAVRNPGCSTAAQTIHRADVNTAVATLQRTTALQAASTQSLTDSIMDINWGGR